MKKNIVFMLALAAVMSLAGCGSSQKAEGEAPKAEESEVTTTAASAETTTTTTAPAETEAPQTETQASASQAAETKEASEGTGEGAVTTSAAAADELDLDAMMSSVEALIPDVTVFTGMDDIKVDINIKKPVVTTASSAAKKPAETTTTVTTTTAKKADKPAVPDPAPAGNVTSMYSLVFDGANYTLPVSGSLALPAGWKMDPDSASRTVARYVKDGYEGSEIDEVERGGDALNGVAVAVVHAMKNGKAYPSLQMYKGITWGSTVDEIKAQYGEPAHIGTGEQYGCNISVMYYTATDGSCMVLTVTDKYGLALVEMYRQ